MFKAIGKMDDFSRIASVLPILQHADPNLLRDFQQCVFFARIPVGRDVFVEGDRADAVALLISGVVRVHKIGEPGREITLYRFGLGESCILRQQRRNFGPHLLEDPDQIIHAAYEEF